MSRAWMDYSFLFQNSSSSAGSTDYSWLSEYSNIKSGTYYKVLKAYYAKQKADGTQSDSVQSKNDTFAAQAKTLDQIQVDAKSLSASAERLITKGSDSLFREEDNADAVYKAVKDFADGYNKLLDSASSASSTGILNQTLHMTNMTKSYERLLGSVGVSIGSDNKLSVDETKLKEADMSTVKTLFNGNASYAYSVATKASMINISANSEANKTSMYTGSGTYDTSYSTGNLLNSIF